MQLQSNNTRPISLGVPTPIQNPEHVRVQVFSAGNNGVTRPSTMAPVHNLIEDAPPSYAAAVSSTTGFQKY